MLAQLLGQLRVAWRLAHLAEKAHQAEAHARGHRLDAVHAAAAEDHRRPEAARRLGFGSIVASEKEATYILVKTGVERMIGITIRSDKVRDLELRAASRAAAPPPGQNRSPPPRYSPNN